MTNFISKIPLESIAAFCHRWKIRELAVFGSALRQDFGPDSDLDILATFAHDNEWGLLDHIQMQLELEKLFQRNVDLISKRALKQSENWIRREEILKTAHVLFSDQEATHATR